MKRLFVLLCLVPLLVAAAWGSSVAAEQRLPAHGPEAALRAAPMQPQYDVIVAGAGTGGSCAAIQAARMGCSVLLLEETDWIGGQMNAAAVTSMDEGSLLVRERGIYREFCERVEAHYRALGKSAETAYFLHNICMEPHVGQQILGAMLAEARKTAPLDIALRTTMSEVLRSGHTVTGVVVQAGTGRHRIACRLLIDATEWGDVLPLTGVRYRVGNCTSDNIVPERRIQDLTWTAVIRQYPQGVPAALLLTNAPPGYTAKVHERFVKSLQAGETVQGRPFDSKTRPWNFTTFVGYRGMPDSASAQDVPPITRTHMNFNNDYEVSIRDVEDPASRLKTCRAAQLRTLQLLYYIQHTLGKTDWSVADDEGFDTPYHRAEVEAWLRDAPELTPYRALLNHFSIMAYARESRRLLGLHTLTAREIERHPGTPTQFPTAVALGDYGIDLHGSMTPRLLEPDLDRPEDMPSESFKRGTGPFAIPFECFIPEKLDGFLAAEKNISQSRLANGATRLQPSTMLMGQAAGAIAALALKYNVPPRQLDPVCVQRVLLAAGSTLFITPFRDVARESPEWPAIQLATVHGMLLPEQGRFGPEKPVSAAQLSTVMQCLFAKNVTSGTEPVTRATFAAALQSGLAGTPVQLAYTANAADQVRAITRSEAAQVLAELLDLRATARMTGVAQPLVWNTVRPTTPTPAIDVGSTLPRDLQRLVARNIIVSADYWLEHAVAGQQCDGALVATLLARAARALEPAATAQPPIEVLARHGVMSTPAYWVQHAQPGQRCGGTTVAALLANLVRQLPKGSAPYSVEQRTTAHGPEVVLRDNAANTTAVVIPQAGFNCWRLAVGPVEFLAPPTDLAALTKGGCGFGWPILFPFPNRVARSEFTFGGKTYRVGPDRGNAIHGFVNTQPWRVTATGTAGGASVTGVTDTDSNPLLKEFWPWPCRLTVTYRLAGRALTMTAVAENLGTEPMPFGIGVHPYNPLPLTPAGTRARCQIQVPCRERLELTPDCLPTGRRLPAAEWLAGRALGDTRLDDVFTATQANANGSACVLRDPDSPWEVTMHADAAFPHWVVYAPKRDVVCFEPYTCVTDAFNLHARGVSDTGFAVLEPGKPWRGTVTMQVREQPEGKEKKP